MKSDEKREIILKAASQCFARYGFDKTTLDDIGKAVGLNKASLYYYYKNKESIFTEVILSESKDYMQSLQKSVETVKLSQEKVLQYLVERLRYYQHVLNLHQLSLDNLRNVEPVFDKLYKSVLEQEIAFVKAIIDDEIKKGSFKQTDSERFAKTIFIVADAIKLKLVQESNVRFASEVDYSTIEEEIKFVINLLFQGLK